MRRTLIIVLAAALMAGGIATTARADAVTDCAGVQGKAFNTLFAAIFKEAGRACGKGSSGSPLAVSEGTMGTAAGKFYAAVGKGVDKSGPAACLITLENLDSPGIRITPVDLLTTVRSLADQACLVP